MKDENIAKDKPCTIYGVSCRSRFKHTSKLIKGYDQPNSMSRALGFSGPYYGQQKLHGFNHLINFSDVETVARWLFENGYDIVKLRDKNGS
jgi:hypothetical protein